MPTLNFEQTFRLAADKWRAGAHADALTLTEALLKAAPQHPNLLNLHGLALMGLSRHDEALAAFEQSLKVAERPDVLNNRALTLKALGRAHDGLDDLLRAVALKPDYADGHASLGRLLRQAGNLGGARVHLERALEIEPAHPRAHADLALALGSNSEVLEAVRHFTEHFVRALPKLRLSTVVADDPEPESSSDNRVDPIAKRNVDPEAYDRALRAMVALLEGGGLEVFLGDGTLLGAVRDKDFISFDKDIDLGLWDAVPRVQVMKLLEASAEFWVTDWGETYKDVMICGRWRDGVAIDLFFYKDAGPDRVWHGLADGEHQTRWRTSRFKLQPMAFRGRTYAAPTDPERYLGELYEDWQRPDPDYCAYVTGDIEGGLPPMAQLWAMRDLFRSIAGGKASRALNIARRLKPRLVHAPEMARLEPALDAFLKLNAASPP